MNINITKTKKALLFSNINILYFFLLLFSLTIRLAKLGENPLSNVEAGLALSALPYPQNNHINSFSQPLYINFTVTLFQWFSLSNFVARFLPALVGSLIIFIPLLFKKIIGEKPTIALSFIFALDPAFIAASRQADSRVMSLVFLAFAIGFFISDKYRSAGISFGLLLLSGTYAWHGIFMLTIILIVMKIISILPSKKIKNVSTKFKLGYLFEKKKMRIFIPWFSLTLLLIGTVFFTKPASLSMVVQSLIDYLNSWIHSASVSASPIVLIVLFLSSYPLVLIPCIMGSINELKSAPWQFMAVMVWILIGLVMYLFYPGHLAVDLIWLTPPLWYFATRINFLQEFNWIQNRKDYLLITLMVICFLGFLWLAGIRFLNLNSPNENFIILIIEIIGSVLLLGLAIILIGWGWSIKVAFNGLFVGIVVISSILQFSIGIHATGTTPRPEEEIWWIGDYFPDAEILKHSINDISLWNFGNKNSIDVSILNVKQPSIEWLLHEHKISINDSISPLENASIVISNDEQIQILEKKYRGQRFIINSVPFWEFHFEQAITSGDFARWFFLREGVIENEDLILWTRNDLFIDSKFRIAE